MTKITSIYFERMEYEDGKTLLIARRCDVSAEVRRVYQTPDEHDEAIAHSMRVLLADALLSADSLTVIKNR